ncbi:MAG: competence protein CoiA family protein, partial [Cyanobacteria bacterium J06555_13]
MAILYSIAKTESGKLIKAAEAEKGPLYFCPHCNTTLVLKKGQKKRPHFAHKSLSPNCKPETALHYGFKTLLAEKIRGHLDRNQALDIAWDCKACGSRHSGNLLRKAVAVELEHDLKVCRPDIALLDDRGKVIAAIEVIVTHSPEQSTLDYFRSNNIALVCFELKSDEDVSRLERSTLKPDNVEVCRNPKCNQCGRHMPNHPVALLLSAVHRISNT